MSKLKKSNVKKKTDRAKEREMALEAEEAKKQEALAQKKKKSDEFASRTMNTIFPLYTLL